MSFWLQNVFQQFSVHSMPHWLCVETGQQHGMSP